MPSANCLWNINILNILYYFIKNVYILLRMTWILKSKQMLLDRGFWYFISLPFKMVKSLITEYSSIYQQLFIICYGMFVGVLCQFSALWACQSQILKGWGSFYSRYHKKGFHFSHLWFPHLVMGDWDHPVGEEGSISNYYHPHGLYIMLHYVMLFMYDNGKFCIYL